MDDVNKEQNMFHRQHCNNVTYLGRQESSHVSADPGNGKVEAGSWLVAGLPILCPRVQTYCSASPSAVQTWPRLIRIQISRYAEYYNVISTFQFKSQIWAGGYNLAEFLAAGKSISNL